MSQQQIYIQAAEDSLAPELLKVVKKIESVVNEAGLKEVNQSGNLNLKLVDDETIRALNKQYSGKDEPTDVLTFSYIEDGAAMGGELADIVISTETAKRQADKAGTELEDELGTLLLHGVLHAFGLDHAAAQERAYMDKLQADLLEKAGLKYRDFGWM